MVSTISARSVAKSNSSLLGILSAKGVYGGAIRDRGPEANNSTTSDDIGATPGEDWFASGTGSLAAPSVPNRCRLSCHRFAAIAVRLQLYALAYNLANFLRPWALPNEVKHGSLTSLRQRLAKIGATVVCHGRSVIFQMAEGRGAACVVPDHPRSDCGSPAVTAGPILRIATPSSRRAYWRERRAQTRGCRSEDPPCGPVLHCKRGAEQAATKEFGRAAARVFHRAPDRLDTIRVSQLARSAALNEERNRRARARPRAWDTSTQMSELGQFRRFRDVGDWSAYPSIAAVWCGAANRRNVPQAVIGLMSVTARPLRCSAVDSLGDLPEDRWPCSANHLGPRPARCKNSSCGSGRGRCLICYGALGIDL
ncbi:unnamed protein product [uncultured bacterium]|nr:unnamed protein product [uncultured bacterium]